MAKCTNCKFAVLEDNGYSNWTVEGTEFSCAKKVHPAGSFDIYYNTAEQLQYAEGCSGFEDGEPVHMDVDGENLAEFSAEEKVIWALHQGD